MRRLLIAGAAVLAVALPAPAAAAPPKKTRVETAVRSAAPDAKRVKESYVKLYAPLQSAPPHPAACDWTSYLRFRDAKGPKSASKADAVLVAMPGFLGGASSFDQVARHVVALAAKRRKHVEFWALERRANCLEDHRGVEYAARTGDTSAAVDYYWRQGEIGHRSFAGFRTQEQVPYLADFGLRRTLEDEFTIVTRGLPSPRTRAKKLFCGGHSLGGPLTAAFAAWDFDGDPATTSDAGYKQCAGFFGLDTQLTLASPAGPGTNDASRGLLATGGQGRYIDAPPATPETLQILSITGVPAFKAPNREGTLLQQVPDTPKIEATFRLLFSRDAANFATGKPSVRDFRLTNEVLVGGVFDDNSSPISIFRASLGEYQGGPVADKSFPTPNEATLLSGDNKLMVPAEPHGPLYSWRHYDRVQADKYTSPASEISDIHQLARALFEAPADFTEQYFPTRILTDVVAAEGGDRSGDLERLRYTDVKLQRTLLIQAAESVVGGAATADRVVKLAGYNHLDVATAAARQNDRKPEQSSTELVKLALGR